MNFIERIAAVLAAFRDAPTLDAASLLRRLDIPVSSGYKLIAAMSKVGLLRKQGRGLLALGEGVEMFFYSPVRTLKLSFPEPVWAARGLPEPRFDVGGDVARWNTGLLRLVDTCRYSRPPPFVIGFANASMAGPWRVAMAQSLSVAARRQRNVAKLIAMDADDDPARQAAQLDSMVAAGVDLCILSAASRDDRELNAAVLEAAEGIPIVGVDRACDAMDSFVSFVTASDVSIGRVTALWMAERLDGCGQVLVLSGRRDATPSQLRLQAALQVFRRFAAIRIIAVNYTDWQPSRAYEQVANCLRAGVRIDGVWCDSGLQGVGSLQAFLDAGYGRGEVPPHTGGDLNLVYKIALTNRVPLCALDYPAAMGGLSFQIALDVLRGRPVPRWVETNMETVISRGHETASVKTDLLAEEKVLWNADDDYIHACGWHPSRSRTVQPVVTPAASHRKVRFFHEILQLVWRHKPGSVYEIARKIGLPLSSAYLFAADMEAMSFLARDEGGRFTTGSRCQEMALNALGYRVAVQQLVPLVKYLHDSAMGAAFIASLDAETLRVGMFSASTPLAPSPVYQARSASRRSVGDGLFMLWLDVGPDGADVEGRLCVVATQLLPSAHRPSSARLLACVAIQDRSRARLRNVCRRLREVRILFEQFRSLPDR